ncbi:UAA transporter family protein [Brugia pahangi]
MHLIGFYFKNNQVKLQTHRFIAGIAIGGVLTGCIGCMVTVEILTKGSPECMNLLTCSTFIFVSFIGFLKQSHYFKQLSRSRAPLLRGYARIVFMFFV